MMRDNMIRNVKHVCDKTIQKEDRFMALGMH